MKIKFFIITILVISFSLLSCNFSEKKNHSISQMSASNSRDSVDWDGTYSGMIPCADCEGILVTITLNQNATYEMTMSYLGKDFEFTSAGSFFWNDRGSIITLDKEDEGMKMFQVGENILFLLDIDGNRITGQFADQYILRKIDQDIIEE